MIQNSLIKLIKNNYQFYTIYSIFLLFSIIFLLNYTNPEISLWFNGKHTSTFNFIFIFFTTIGDGSLFAIVLIILGFYNMKHFFNGLILYLGSNIVTHIIKLMYNSPRPLKFFGPEILNQIDGVSLHANFSFPSGHTTSGFAIFLFLAFITKAKNISYIYISAAIMVGISRVYLLQHFYIDIFAGSIISVAICTLLYDYLDNIKKIQSKNWYNYSFYHKHFNKNVSRETIIK